MVSTLSVELTLRTLASMDTGVMLMNKVCSTITTTTLFSLKDGVLPFKKPIVNISGIELIKVLMMITKKCFLTLTCAWHTKHPLTMPNAWKMTVILTAKMSLIPLLTCMEVMEIAAVGSSLQESLNSLISNHSISVVLKAWLKVILLIENNAVMEKKVTLMVTVTVLRLLKVLLMPLFSSLLRMKLSGLKNISKLGGSLLRMATRVEISGTLMLIPQTNLLLSVAPTNSIIELTALITIQIAHGKATRKGAC
jgi:hypothetical protein